MKMQGNYCYLSYFLYHIFDNALPFLSCSTEVAKKDQLGRGEQPRAIPFSIASNLAHAEDRLPSMKEKIAIKAVKKGATKNSLDVHAASPDVTPHSVWTSSTVAPVSFVIDTLADETKKGEVSVLNTSQSLDFEKGEDSN